MTKKERAAEFMGIIEIYMTNLENGVTKSDRVEYMDKILGACMVAKFTNIIPWGCAESISTAAIEECYRIREEVAL